MVIFPPIIYQTVWIQTPIQTPLKSVEFMQSKKKRERVTEFSMEWSRPGMCWTDAMKLTFPDAKAVSMLMEIYYAMHGQKEAQIENPNGSEHQLLRCDRQRYVKGPIPYQKSYKAMLIVPKSGSKDLWWKKVYCHQPQYLNCLSVNGCAEGI